MEGMKSWLLATIGGLSVAVPYALPSLGITTRYLVTIRVAFMSHLPSLFFHF